MKDLAPQQERVCNLLLQDKNIKEISEEMGISESTVKLHILLAKRKYEVKTLAGLAVVHYKNSRRNKRV